MDPERMEQFFKAYLEMHGLEYKLKNQVYTVQLDKHHKQLYGTDTLTCTFDHNVSREKNITLLGCGTFIFDSMISAFADKTMIANLHIPQNEQELLKLNERLPELRKQGMPYKISESETSCTYALFEITFHTAHRKQRIQIPLIIKDGKPVRAEGMEQNTFELVKEKVEAKKLAEESFQHVTVFIAEEIASAEQEHEKNMQELLAIEQEHVETQYAELRKEEQLLQSRIDATQEKEISAQSFEVKDKYNNQIKSMKRKLAALQKKNDAERRRIKAESDERMAEIRKRELHLEAKALALAKITMPAYTIAFDDKTTFEFLPAVGQFVEKQSSKSQYS